MTLPPNPSPPSSPESSDLDRAVAIWTKVVQTQEHFNDICMRVRALYSTLVGAIIAAYGFLLDKSKENLDLGEVEVDAIIPLALSGFFISALFYFVDRYWYHALLLGAVDQGKEIEDRWKLLIPDIQLGAKISSRSAVDLTDKPFKLMFAGFFVSDSRLKTTKKLHSDAKIEIFYKPIIWLMGLVALGAVFAGGIKVDGNNPFFGDRRSDAAVMADSRTGKPKLTKQAPQKSAPTGANR